MRFALLSLAAAAALATPAMANEARFEGRGGIVWGNGDSEATAGVAAGYDWDLGESAFAGIETSADKILDGRNRVSFGSGVRLGVKTAPDSKIYGAASYQTKPCRTCEESIAAGVGYQQGFGNRMYGKVEYRHHFVGDNIPDYDAAMVGVGVKF